MGRSKVFYILSQPEFNYSNHSERIELVIKGILKFNKKTLKRTGSAVFNVDFEHVML